MLPDVYRRNAVERSIWTFKAHFLEILSGVNRAFPSSLWDTLLTQTELTLNLLYQATLAPYIWEREYYNGPNNYDAKSVQPHRMQILHPQQTQTTQDLG